MGSVAGAVAGGLASGIAGSAASSLMSDSPEAHKVSRYTPAQRELLGNMTTVLNRQLEGPRGVAAYPERTVPGLQPTQEEALKQGRTLLEEQVPALRERAGGLLQAKEWRPEEERERWHRQFYEPAREQWREETVPELKEQFAANNALDSDAFNRALAESAQDIQEEGMRNLSDMLYKSKQRREERNLNRAQLGSSLLGQSLGLAEQAGGLGEQARKIEQARRGEMEEKWKYSRPYNNPWLQQYYNPTIGVQPNQTYLEKPSPGFGATMLSSVAPALGKAAQTGVQSWLGGGSTNAGGGLNLPSLSTPTMSSFSSGAFQGAY